MGSKDLECRFRLHLTTASTADGTAKMTPRMATINSADPAIAVSWANAT